MKVREVIHLLEQVGWQQVVQRGRHRQFRHPTKPGRVTVTGKPSQELAPGLLGSVLRQSGLLKPSDLGRGIKAREAGAGKPERRFDASFHL